MKARNLYHGGRRIIAATIGVVAFLSPMVVEAADDAQIDQVTIALASPQAYQPSVGQSGVRMASMEARWERIQQAVRPETIVRLSESFAKDFPDSKYSEAERNISAGARKALAAQRAARLSSDAIEEVTGDSAYRNELASATHGDKDAAYRIAAMYRHGTNGLPSDTSRAEQWLRIAAELGHAEASWQVAQIYNSIGFVADAARFEAKAAEAGYRLPIRLPTKGRNI